MAFYFEAKSVRDERVVSLAYWQVFEVETGERHFCRVVIPEMWGRTTSPIVAYDAIAQVGQTRSGRIYLLHGPPTASALVDGVWERRCHYFSIPYSMNVSDEYGEVAADPWGGIDPSAKLDDDDGGGGAAGG